MDKKSIKTPKKSILHQKQNSKIYDKKIKEKFPKIIKSNLSHKTQLSSDRNKMPKMKTSVKFNNKEESKKVEKKLFTDEENDRLNNDEKEEKEEKEME